jgi:hypothetical protein
MKDLKVINNSNIKPILICIGFCVYNIMEGGETNV